MKSSSLSTLPKNALQKFQHLPKFLKIGSIIVITVLLWFGWTRIKSSQNTAPAYQTATVSKNALIISVSVSGQVSNANSAEITTQASGVVKTVYVKDGDQVKAGDKIADIDLDLVGKQRSQAAYASYQSAKNNLDTAKANLYNSQSTLLTEWESFMDTAQNDTYENQDGSPNEENRRLTDFVITQNDWLSSEAKYKIQENTITQAQTLLSSSWYSYQQSSPTIVAPISGTITGLSLRPGMVITAQTNSSGGSSSQRIASVKTDAAPVISLNLTQIDAPKVSAGNKATISIDAFPDKTFTGEVVSVDTIGTESSGVTTYPAIITLDTNIEGLLPNMSANATIITATKTDALLVPRIAIQTENGQTFVRVMKNGQITSVPVETGLSSDSDTEILSGLSEGEEIITSVTIGSSVTTQNGQSSPFSPFGGAGSRSGSTIRMVR